MKVVVACCVVLLSPCLSAQLQSGPLTGPTWIAEGNQIHAHVGSSIAPAGDVNGDGFTDILLGSSTYPNGGTQEGRIDLYLGSAAGLAIHAAASIEGDAIATAGDVNGDGYSDVIVGIEYSTPTEWSIGRAAVYLGSAAGLEPTPSWSVEGEQAGVSFGSSVSTAGDVNGDGYSDVIVAAVGFDNDQMDEGRTYVYLGSANGLSTTAAWTAEGDRLAAFFGASVAPAGDVNGDGFGDVIVGVYGYHNQHPDQGQARVYLGSSTGLSSIAHWTGEGGQPGALFGSSVAPAGDVNGDGFGDVIVGAKADGIWGEGRAFLYLGSSSGLATSAAWSAEGDQDGAEFGTSVATAGDVNGDGYSDVIIGARHFENGEEGEGRSFLYLGSNAGLVSAPAWTAEGDQSHAYFGTHVSTAGDVDGDGYSDVLVAAPYFDNGQIDEGRAYLFSGSAAGLASTSGWSVQGDQTHAVMGNSVGSAGDVNGDGYGDVIVGATSYDGGLQNEGRAFVYLGASSGLTPLAAWTAGGGQAGALFGTVARAGDVNGDGYGDIVIGAILYDDDQPNDGGAFVYLGSASGLASTPACTLGEDHVGGNFGGVVASAGDVNGDGYGDVIALAQTFHPNFVNEGRACLYLGSASGLSTTAAWTANGEAFNIEFGGAMSTAGDVNGDGFSDVIVGAPVYSNGENSEGRAFVYLGSRTGLSTSPAWTAESDQPLARFGHSVATAGDVNGDGYSDVIVGANDYDHGETNEGAAFVYLGSAAGLAARAAWTGEINQDNAYLQSVSSAGDVNGDGYSDVLVTTGEYDDPTNSGIALLYLGSASGLSIRPTWTAGSGQFVAFFGSSGGSAGDVNGDGYADVIVGAPGYDDGEDGEGAAFLYYGNDGRGGWTLAPSQRRSNDSAPIDLLGALVRTTEFRIRLGFEHSLAGFAWASGATPAAHLEWEVCRLGDPLDGSRIDAGMDQQVTGTPLVFDELVRFPSVSTAALTFGAPLHTPDAGQAIHWRARLRTNNPLFPVTPWVTLPGNNVTESKLRTGRPPMLRAPR